VKCMTRKIKRMSDIIPAEKKLQLADLVTYERQGNVSLKHNPDKSFWVVTLGHKKVYTYKSSTWAQNKYRRLLIISGIIDERDLLERDGDLCEKEY
jgi:hypothetical protein